MKRVSAWITYLQVAPLALVFLLFLVVPILTIVVVSFFDYNTTQIIPDFLIQNYEELLLSPVTWRTYAQTVEFAVITWVLTLLIGFTVAYFLAFHVRSATWQTVLFLVCTIPFWTSNVIRMISWIPFLGRNGLANTTLMQLGLIREPLEFLLFSDFAVVLAYVHLYTLFMVVPIFNSMMRIDRSLLEAARDAGATGWQTLRFVIVPLCKPGIAIGSIFIVTIVMGDFVTVRMMSGGQSASVVADDGERHVAAAVSGGGGQCRGPAAARPVHRRRHDAHGRHPEGAVSVQHGRRGPGFWLLAGFFGLFVLFLYGPTITILVLSFQGPTGGLTFPMQGVSVHWFGNLFEKQMVGDFAGSFERSMALGVAAMLVTVVASFSAGLAFRTRFRGSALIFYLAIASLIVPSVLVSLGIGLLFRVLGWDPAWYSSAFGAHLTWTLPFGLLIMFAVFNRFDRRYEEAARDLGATSWQTIRYIVVPILLPSLIGVGLFGFTLSYDEFARSLYTVGHLQHPAARDLRHDHQRHHAGALCAGHGDHRRVLPGDRHCAGIGHHAAPPPRAPRQRRRQGGMTHASPRAACCGWRPPGRRIPRRWPPPSPPARSIPPPSWPLSARPRAMAASTTSPAVMRPSA